MNTAPNVLHLIGKTPLVAIPEPDLHAELYAKLEYCNPGGSVKDRIALAMVEAAERDAKITRNSVIIEPTSGNVWLTQSVPEGSTIKV